MKKSTSFIILAAMFSSSYTLLSQVGQKWATGGNSLGTGDFLGSTNNSPVVFKTNNIQRGGFSASGVFRINNLGGTGTRLLAADGSGNILPFAWGTSSQVLYGSGQWGNLPAAPSVFWNASGNNIFFNNGTVGIGTTSPNPLYTLDVIGDARISNDLYVGGGVIITDKVNATSAIKSRSLSADSIHMDSTRAIVGSTRIVGDAKVSQELTVFGNTFLSGSAKVSGIFSAPTIFSGRITTTDSVLHFGDSSIVMQPNYFDATAGTVVDRIFARSNTAYRGFGIGRFTYPAAAHSIASGFDARTNAMYSFALGNWVRTGAAGNYSFVIGSGKSTAPLVNNIPNSLMIGFSSDKPTITVGTTNAGHNTGSILIGATTSNPIVDDHIKMSVVSEADGITGFFLSSSTSEQYNSVFKVKNDASKALAVFYTDANGADHENFIVRGNGYVFARRLQVTALTPFPDYVFDKDYKFLSIPELKSYIEKNKKLPEYRSAKEVEKEGMDVGEITRLNTQSIEQLTLYLISIYERLEKTEKENKQLEKKISEMERAGK